MYNQFSSPSDDRSGLTFADLVEATSYHCRAIVERGGRGAPLICLKGAACRAHKQLRDSGHRAEPGYYVPEGSLDLEESLEWALSTRVADEEVALLRDTHDRVNELGRSAVKSTGATKTTLSRLTTEDDTEYYSSRTSRSLRGEVEDKAVSGLRTELGQVQLQTVAGSWI